MAAMVFVTELYFVTWDVEGKLQMQLRTVSVWINAYNLIQTCFVEVAD